nr:MAG TPA: hypothetical protein [Caudoviricetes sp.]
MAKPAFTITFPPQSNLAGCTNVLRCRIFSNFR